MAIKASSQETLIDLTDGYSVHLTIDNHTFLGTTDSVSGTQSVAVKIMALCGGDQVSCSVGTITTKTGISAVSDGKTPEPTIMITATAALKTSGSFTIPVVIGDVTINKTFSYTIAFKGQNGTGVTIKSTAVTYQASASGTATPTGSWVSVPPSVPAGQYLWTKTVVIYSDGESTTSYSISRNAADGVAGADALSLVITSSGGTIFKNTAIATTLTAHVYKGGVEVIGAALTALGAIKWYKDGATTAVATGTTLTITAGDVNSKATYEVRLEG